MSSELTGIKSLTKNVLISSDLYVFFQTFISQGGTLNAMIKCLLSFCVGKDYQQARN